MSKLNEAAAISSPSDVEYSDSKTEEESLGDVERKETTATDDVETGEKKAENDEKNIIKFTMLFNKYNCVRDMKRRNEEDKRDNKYAMFFNKEVTIRKSPEVPSTAAKILEAKNSGFLNPRIRPTRAKSKPHPLNLPMQEPEFSEPGFMFCTSLFSSLPDVCERTIQTKFENTKKLLNKRNPRMEANSLVQLNVYPATVKDLRNHTSLTNLSKFSKTGLKGVLKSKIPSLTALDSNPQSSSGGQQRFGYWDHWDDLILMQNDVEKRLNLQISRSSNDNNRRSVLKFKKEDPASVSDSKLLFADSESKKHIKKCDKKSRGDSLRKERNFGNRKQVQWKTEVDVIYFSIQQAVNGDKTGEVIGRVMEPLREEWEQQRKGFYAKVAPSHMESHVKDHFISLLKI